jgi:hypothetical protein
MNRSQRACHPNALNFIDDPDTIIFTHIQQAIREQRELRTIATTIMEGQAARAWSMDQGLIFFDGCFYLPTASALLSDLLQVLRRGGSANIELLALGTHLPPTHGVQLNRMPSHILLGHP